MKHGRTPLDLGAENLMKAHVTFCLGRAKAYSGLGEANKFQALQEEVHKLKAAVDSIVSMDEKIVLTGSDLHWAGVVAINAAAAAGALLSTVNDIKKRQPSGEIQTEGDGK